MARRRIVCTEQEPVGQPHDAHIEAVGVGDDPTSADEQLTVGEVYRAMDRGDTFYTKSRKTGKEAEVHKYECGHCGKKTLRSDADATEDNNLDNLRECNWR